MIPLDVEVRKTDRNVQITCSTIELIEIHDRAIHQLQALPIRSFAEPRTRSSRLTYYSQHPEIVLQERKLATAVEYLVNGHPAPHE
jgi:hypothetical protein